MSRTDPEYFVHTGDTTYYFAHGKRYLRSYLNKVFKKRTALIDSSFPGLILADEEGTLWKPELQIVLVPAPEPEPEEELDG